MALDTRWNMNITTAVRHINDTFVIIPGMENAEELEQLIDDVSLVSVTGFDWDGDLSPWYADRVFRKGRDFAGNADGFIGVLVNEIIPELKEKYGARKFLLAGYSLAGLFALYAGAKTEAFTGIVSASGSLWFPGFTDWLETHPVHAQAVYLSLGDKEPVTRNPLMASVGTCTEKVRDTIGEYADVTFEWNEGNHFNDENGRLAKGIRWILEHTD